MDDELHQDLVQISREQTSQVIIKFLPINAHHTPWGFFGGGGEGKQISPPPFPSTE